MADSSVISVNGIGVSQPEATAVFFPMRDPVVFPFGLTPLLVDGEDKLAILRRAMASDRLLAIFPEMPDDEELGTLPVKVSLKIFTYAEKRRSMVGVLARVVKELKFPDGSVRIVVRGVKRISFSKLELADSVPIARFRGIPENREENENEEVIARQKSVLMLFQELAGMMPGLPDELQVAVLNAGSPARMADMIADSMSFSYPEKLLLLVLSEVRARQEFLAILLNRELEVMKLSMKIQSEVSQAMSQQQREFYLREQLRTIQEELGEDSRNPDIIELEKRIGETELPDKVSEVVAKEMARLEVIPQAAPISPGCSMCRG